MSQDSIQAIFIKQTETHNDEGASKPYTAYRIDVQAAVRQWHLWKRYSDFTKLHAQLTETFPHNSIPAQLPQKRIFPPTFHAPDRVEDRRQGLENYVRTIQSCRDDRWRKTDVWQEFLALPAVNNSNNDKKKKPLFSIGSWLDEYDDLLSLSREIRSLINSRNAHQSQHQVSEAMHCEVTAKKDLMTLSARLGNLESSLKLHEEGALAEGEERRREDKLSALKSERDVLLQLVNVTRPALPITKTKVVAPPLNKQQQQHSSSASPFAAAKNEDIGFDQPNNVRRAKTTQHPRQGRAFGSAFRQQQEQLKETEFTKGLDNKELLDYQTQIMKDQDLHVEQFSQLLSRQKELGIAINHELENQIDVLESLDIQVDNTTTKLAFANKKLSKIK